MIKKYFSTQQFKKVENGQGNEIRKDETGQVDEIRQAPDVPAEGAFTDQETSGDYFHKVAYIYDEVGRKDDPLIKGGGVVGVQRLAVVLEGVGNHDEDGKDGGQVEDDYEGVGFLHPVAKSAEIVLVAKQEEGIFAIDVVKVDEIQLDKIIMMLVGVPV